MKTAHSILQHSPLALATTEGPMHIVRDVNPAFCALHGKQSGEIIGRTVSSVIVGPCSDTVVALLDRIYAGDKCGSVDNLNFTDPDNSQRYRSYVAWSLPVMEGWSSDLVIQVTDLTEGIRAQRTKDQMLELNSEVREINEQLVITGLGLQDLANRNRAIADALQSSILWDKSEKSFGDLTVSAIYEPAVDCALVGGDLFDAVMLPDGSVMLMVGDVTGKGLQAASRVSEVIFAMRAFALDFNRPSAMLARLNELLCKSHPWDEESGNLLVALSVVELNPTTGVAHVACAGAEPPVVLRASGSTEILDIRGLILGIERGAEYMAMDFVLEAGDLLLMTTDGVTETHRGSNFFGYDRMIATAREAAETGGLKEIGTAIVEAARAYGGGQFSDDICLVLARR